MIGVQTGKEKEKACGRKRKQVHDQNYYQVHNQKNYLFCLGEQKRVQHAELQKNSNTEAQTLRLLL